MVPPNSRRLGEFAVEWYCNEKGYGVKLINSRADWACTSKLNGSVVLTLAPSDFDSICQSWYHHPSAFALLDQQKTVRAYNWSCYEYVGVVQALPSTLTATDPSLAVTPSLATMRADYGQDWIALINRSKTPLSLDNVELQREGYSLKASAWGPAMLMPGACLRIYKDKKPPDNPDNCATVIDYEASAEERTAWFRDKLVIFVSPTFFYCFPSGKCG